MRGMPCAEILSRTNITAVYRALGGPEPRGNRAPAFWRGGDGYNVALENGKGAWYDHARGEGGGILDLVMRVLGCGRQEALRWVAETVVGVPLEDGKVDDPDFKRRLAATRKEAEDLVRWRNGLVAALRDYRDSWLGARDRARRYILRYGLEGVIGDFAADVEDVAEREIERAQQAIDAIRRASWAALVPIYRATRQREAVA